MLVVIIIGIILTKKNYYMHTHKICVANIYEGSN